MKKRMIFIGVLFSMLSFALVGRLAYIQIIGGEELSVTAIKQQKISLDGIDFRGVIYDRNMTPLTSKNKEYMVILLKEKYDTKVAAVLNEMKARKLSIDDNKYYVYGIEDYDAEAWKLLEDKYNIYSLETNKRYENNQTAAHLIGYINQRDGNGISGLELLYDSKLENNSSNYFAIADARGSLISGIGLSKGINNQSYGIVTTLDEGIQRTVEEVLKDSGYNGAIVVQDVEDGGILACASSPVFDPNEMNQYIDSDNKELIDKVFQGEYPPGSIFKIVVAAAALESGISPNTVFNCCGYEEINGVTFGCSTGGETGHGEINLTDAFAYSCNSAFIQLGEMTGAENILNMAEKMGLGKEPIDNFPNIKNGNLPICENCRGAGIGNLSIGQGEVLVTPLQVTKIINIIANEGIDKDVQIVKEVLGEDNEATNKVALKGGLIKQKNRVISKQTAKKLLKMMQATMEYGTGNNLSVKENAAGKTGSAEAYDNGEYLVHGWFAGFYPVENPKYTVVIFAENGRSGRKSAVPIFEELVKKLP